MAQGQGTGTTATSKAAGVQLLLQYRISEIVRLP